jgi:hypothetical protein
MVIPRMNRINPRWNVMLVVVVVAGLLGCQGVSTGKSSQITDPGQITPALTSIGFGNVQIGTSQTKTDIVANTGGSSITITQATVTGTGFSISGWTLPLTLGVGQRASVSIIFTPQSAGSASGNIAVSTDNGTANITLSATAVAAGDLTTSPTSFTFGNVLVGNTSSQTETLKNTGLTDLTVTAATITGSGFNYAGLSLPLILAPNQASTFSVSFAPTTAASSNGNLSLTVSGSTTSLDMALSGAGVTPANLTANPTSLTFTNVQVGNSSTQTVTVKNTGGSNAQISQVKASGTGFSVSAITTPVTLISGQSTSFSVTFSPGSAGNFSGSVSVTSDASYPNLTVALTGSAVAATQSTLSVSPTPISVGNVVVGLSGQQTGTLTATGGNVKVSSVSVGGTNPSEFSISGLSLPVTIAAGNSVNFTVTFTPQASGAATATVSFTSDASNSPTAGTLTGTGTPPPVHTVQLSWAASTTTGVTSYNVYRAIFVKNSCGSYSNIGSTPSSLTSFTDNVVTDGATYCYSTTAVDPSGESVYSNVVQAAIPPQ